MADCKTCEYENVCTMPDFVRNDLKRCKVYEEKKQQTNADRIRAMSDEELAEFINMVANDSIDTMVGYKDYTEIWEDKEPTLQWLKSAVKE